MSNIWINYDHNLSKLGPKFWYLIYKTWKSYEQNLGELLAKCK